MEQVRAHSHSDRTLALLYRTGWRDQNGSSMIGGSIERASSDRSEPTSRLSLSSLMKSNSSSSKSGLNLAITANTRNAINANKQNAPYTSNTSATVPAPGLSVRTPNQ